MESSEDPLKTEPQEESKTSDETSDSKPGDSKDSTSDDSKNPCSDDLKESLPGCSSDSPQGADGLKTSPPDEDENECSTSSASGSSNELLVFYLHTRDDCFKFSSDVFRFEINGFPDRVKYFQVRNFLQELDLKQHKIKIFKGKPQSVSVTFGSKEDFDHAVETISKNEWKDRTVSTSTVSPMMDPLLRKRKAVVSSDAENAKLRRTENEMYMPLAVMLKNNVTPLWNLPYEEQLMVKEKELRMSIHILVKNIGRFTPSSQKYNRKPCPLFPTVPSPVTVGYCNRWEFRVSTHPETNYPVVGVGFDSRTEYGRCVAEANHCNNIPDHMLRATKVFEMYVRGSRLPVYNAKTLQGFWHKLTVRTTFLNQMMLIIVMHPQNLKEAEIENEKKRLRDFFAECNLYVTSVYFQRFSKKEQEKQPMEYILGSEYIEEELGSLQFRISPDVFFHANTLGAQVMYQTVAEFGSLNKNTIVLDLCCGCGALGIYLAKGVRKVIGIESCESAVEDAKHNADWNGIFNAEFICGTVENKIAGVMESLKGHKDVVAVLDSPLSGMSVAVVHAIQELQNLRRLVYLTSNPKSSMNKFIQLCCPAKTNYQGPSPFTEDFRKTPFRPVKAVAVDLFPETRYCELVLLFERREIGA